MPSFDHQPFEANKAVQQLLPGLYKFAIVLSANEQLARALLRGTLRMLNARKDASRTAAEAEFEALRAMHNLWAAKLAQNPGLQSKNPPDPNLLARFAPKGAPVNTQFARFVTGLSCEQRAALYLIYGQRCSYDETAELLGLNLHALMGLLARAHLALGQWLDHRGEPYDGRRHGDDTHSMEAPGVRLKERAA